MVITCLWLRAFASCTELKSLHPKSTTMDPSIDSLPYFDKEIEIPGESHHPRSSPCRRHTNLPCLHPSQALKNWPEQRLKRR